MKVLFLVILFFAVTGCASTTSSKNYNCDYQLPIDNIAEKMNEANRFGLIYDKKGSHAYIKTEENTKLHFSLFQPFNVGDRVRLYIDNGFIYKVEVVK